MNVIEGLHMRKSIRGYKQDPVSRDVIAKILENATRAPSAENTQPWELTVVTGKALDDMRQENIRWLNAGKEPSPTIIRKPYENIYRKRRIELAVELFELAGIRKDDKESRANWSQRGFRYFDAPAIIIVCIDKSMQASFALFDCGALCQSICIAALEYGLGTCITEQGILFPETVRKYARIPESKQIIVNITIGYPDWTFPANKLVSKRDPLDSITTWIGYD